MNIEEILNKIYSLHQFDIKLGLEKITALLNFLGNPQEKFKSIHIAGSNGKGSTASYVASILMEAGYKVGLYTSPHLMKFNERIRINGVMIEDDYIINFINRLDEYIKKHRPTFFEITTALAFSYFAEKGIQIGVIETGLGGRLDATNVINPIGTIITTISLEHTNILGNTLKQIAFEKGGIIKPNIKCFIGNLVKEAEEEILEICDKVHSEAILLKKYIAFNKNICNISTNNFIFTIYNPVLKGIHQFYNLSLAIISVFHLFGINKSITINRGINNVLKNSGLQGRFEIYNSNPVVILEAAHNPESIKAFKEIFEKEIDKYQDKTVIFGVMKDKNIPEMLNDIKYLFNNFYFVNISYERAEKAENLLNIAKERRIEGKILDDPITYIKLFIQNNQHKNNCLVVLGSIYLLGEIKIKLNNY